MNRVSITSKWTVEHFDKHGNLKSRTVDENIVTNQGLNALLDIMFGGSTQITTWYIAPFEDDHTPAAGDTYAVPGYTETEAYDEATRPAFVEAPASSQSMTNSASKASFTFNDTKTIYGAALVGGGTDGNTIGDAAGGGTLYCASKFSASKPVEDDDVLKIQVTLTAADA